MLNKDISLMSIHSQHILEPVCPPLYPPRHGTLEYSKPPYKSGYGNGTVAYFMCNVGQRLVGTQSVTCLYRLHWHPIPYVICQKGNQPPHIFCQKCNQILHIVCQQYNQSTNIINHNSVHNIRGKPNGICN